LAAVAAESLRAAALVAANVIDALAAILTRIRFALISIQLQKRNLIALKYVRLGKPV